jgi:hypothetical protein
VVCFAGEIHPHRDSVKKFNIQEIRKSTVDSSIKSGELTIFTYNQSGDVVKEIFCLVERDTVKFSDTLLYKYWYDDLGRPACRMQVGVRRNTLEQDCGINPLRADSIYTCWYYNANGWMDSITNIHYSSFQWDVQRELPQPLRTTTIYTYEPYKDLTILRENKIMHEGLKRDRVISSDYIHLQLFRDNPAQITKIVTGCGNEYGRTAPAIMNILYVQRGHLTYVYRAYTAGRGGCDFKTILMNDTATPVFADKPGTAVSITDPLGNFVLQDTAVFNTLGLLTKQNHSYLHYTFSYTFFEE